MSGGPPRRHWSGLILDRVVYASIAAELAYLYSESDRAPLSDLDLPNALFWRYPLTSSWRAGEPAVASGTAVPDLLKTNYSSSLRGTAFDEGGPRRPPVIFAVVVNV